MNISAPTVNVDVSTEINLIDLVDHAGWHAFTDSNKNTSLAHNLNWYSAFQATYGHRPLYFIAKQNSTIVGILPAYLIHIPVTGNVITSMPFWDVGGPCVKHQGLEQDLLGALKQEANRLDVNYIEIHSMTDPQSPRSGHICIANKHVAWSENRTVPHPVSILPNQATDKDKS